MASRICARWWIPSAGAAKARGRSARPEHAAGRWALLRPRAEQLRSHRTKRSPINCCCAGAWYFAICWRARRWRRPGAILLVVLRRMEARGEIRGGRFVAGFVGEQFARPEAIELLRAMRRSEDRAGAVSPYPTADPLNLAGIILPGPRVSALSGGTSSCSASRNSPPPELIESVYIRPSMRTLI